MYTEDHPSSTIPLPAWDSRVGGREGSQGHRSDARRAKSKQHPGSKRGKMIDAGKPDEITLCIWQA